MSTEPAPVARPVTGPDRSECPATRVLHRLGDRWSTLVICLLAERPHGFNELDRAVAGLSRRILTRTLRTLEAEGYLSRTALSRAPYRVEYALTALGSSLHEAVLGLGAWAELHRDRLAAAEHPPVPRTAGDAAATGGAATG
ncbi:helix-turn-helix transcriptional regulator [Kitasatospora sp. NBC_01560]|uniref:winged helix-turn-helix transcriptional regulator n=1 Tax=Kitasatospora sp. NBC_01560 TaxID=2975965 RepID=UPI00386FA0ED